MWSRRLEEKANRANGSRLAVRASLSSCRPSRAMSITRWWLLM